MGPGIPRKSICFCHSVDVPSLLRHEAVAYRRRGYTAWVVLTIASRLWACEYLPDNAMVTGIGTAVSIWLVDPAWPVTELEAQNGRRTFSLFTPF